MAVVPVQEIKERDNTISEKEKRIYDLKKKNQELEKFKFVLDHKIKELKKQIEPKEEEIADMKEQIKVLQLQRWPDCSWLQSCCCLGRCPKA